MSGLMKISGIGEVVEDDGDSRKDYRVTVKVRNNNILSRIEGAGLTPPKLAKNLGISYQGLNDLINMKTTPFERTGEIKEWVVKMLVFLKCSLGDLFSDEQYEAFEKNTFEREFSLDGMIEYLSRQAEPSSFEQIKDASQEAKFAMSCLTERERFVIDSLLMEGLTLEEVGVLLDVSRERINQIFMKAQRKMRKKLGIVHVESFDLRQLN